jgi:hypothetical protein
LSCGLSTVPFWKVQPSARWILSRVSCRIPIWPASIFAIVRECNPQRAASSSWLIRSRVRSRLTSAPSVFRSASLATLFGRGNGEFLNLFTWLERKIGGGDVDGCNSNEATSQFFHSDGDVVRLVSKRLCVCWSRGLKSLKCIHLDQMISEDWMQLVISFANCLQGEVISHPQNPKNYSFDFHRI